MLTVVCLQKRRRRSWKEWVWAGFRRPAAIDPHFVTVGSGRYLCIDAFFDNKKGVDWEAVRQAAGRESGRLLLPEGIPVPADSGLHVWHSEGLLQRQMMQQTALWLLQTRETLPSERTPRRITAAVYDPAGYMPDLPVSLVPYAADVRVITRRPEAYRYAQTLAMEEYGASIAVTGEAEALKEARLILALQPMGDARPTGKRLILTAQPEGLPLEEGTAGAFRPSAGKLVVEPPAGIDEHLFLAGLYELSGIREIASCRPASFLLDGKERPVQELLQRMPGLDIPLAV